MPISRGVFVVFEGGDGSGKSTQTQRLAAGRVGAVATRQPGGTEIGRTIRELCLSPSIEGLSPRAEALLMAADRAQHVAQVIEPALAAGSDVVCDRYVASSLAYQGAARGLGVDAVQTLSDFAVAGTVPDVVFLLDIPIELGLRRAGDDLDRLEREGAAFHQLVRDTYLVLAENDPDRWVKIDASGSPDEIAALVDAEMKERFGWGT